MQRNMCALFFLAVFSCAADQRQPQTGDADAAFDAGSDLDPDLWQAMPDWFDGLLPDFNLDADFPSFDAFVAGDAATIDGDGDVMSFDAGNRDEVGEDTKDADAVEEAARGPDAELFPERADTDGDGFFDDEDNCPNASNRYQYDADGDGVGDLCDNCRYTPNPEQGNADGDLLGSACDPDTDGDGVRNEDDSCPPFFNPDQRDTDGDGKADACDTDPDGDGWGFLPTDNCRLKYNPGQEDRDRDNIGDVCDECPNTPEWRRTSWYCM